MRLRLKIWHRRQRYVIRQQPVLNRLYRVGVGFVGTLMVLAGLAMIPLPIPGPGWVTFFLGLGVLSTEFVWAHRVTSFMRAMLHKANLMVANSLHAIREFHGRRLDYQSGVRYVRSWVEHQRAFGLGQFQFPQLALTSA